MPICIECRYPLRTLYTTYSKADDRSLGKGVRLTQCPRCKRFGDKYVEHDFVVLFIDLVLIKPQVYRHLLFNRLGREDDRFDPSIIRLGILLLLFDVYLTWARIEKSSGNNEIEGPSPLSTQPLVLQYIFFLGLCTAQTLAFHVPIRLLCSHPPRVQLPPFLARLRRGAGTPSSTVPPATTAPGTVAPAAAPPPLTALNGTAVPSAAAPAHQTTAPTTTTPNHLPVTPSVSGTTTPTALLSTSTTTTSSATSSYFPTSAPHTAPSPPSSSSPSPHTIALVPHYPHPTPLSTALLVSSCTKLFPLLLIIWDYDLPSSASAVSWAVIVNNVAALEILMDCGYLRAGLLVGIGAAVRAVVGEVVLASVGLRGRGASAAGWEELFGWGRWW